MVEDSNKPGPWSNPRVRWVVVGALLAAGVVYVAWASRKGESILPFRQSDQSLASQDSRDVRALKIEPVGADFGEVPVDETHTRRLSVTNSGPRAVSVTAVVSTCPCVSGRMLEKQIGPGKSQVLELSFRGVPGKRSYQTVVALVTDESGPSRYEVPVTGLVQTDFRIEPDILNFGKLERGSNRTLSATVRMERGSSFEIREARTASADFMAVWTPIPGEKTAVRVDVTALPVRTGRVTEEILLVTEPSTKGSPVLVASFEVPSDVICDPEVVTATQTDATGVAVFETTIHHATGTPVEIESIREARGLQVEFSAEQKPGGFCKLQIRVTGKAGESCLGNLLLKTTSEPEAVHLPYRVEIPKAPAAGKP